MVLFFSVILTHHLATNAGYVYFTDDNLPDPYDTMPSFWTQEVNLAGIYRN
jgi:hypothetical protein